MIVPTGFGKSACYQIPSMLLPKPVVLISPLLAFLEDQHQKMLAAEVPCVRLDGSVRGKARREAFERIAGWSFDHRWVVLAICLALLGVCAYFASLARFDNSFEAFFDTDDPAYAAYNQFREDFGSDEIAYILYEAPGRPHGPFDLEVMRPEDPPIVLLEDVRTEDRGASQVTWSADGTLVYAPGSLIM